MNFKVKKIHLTADYLSEPDYDPKADNTDVVVIFEDNRKFIASFFAYESINKMQLQHQVNGNFHNGDYLWDKNMVLVKDCAINTIKPVIMDLIDEGDFQDAFREL